MDTKRIVLSLSLIFSLTAFAQQANPPVKQSPYPGSASGVTVPSPNNSNQICTVTDNVNTYRVPCSLVQVNSITPGSNVTCTPNVGGTCTGSVTVSASVSGNSGLYSGLLVPPVVASFPTAYHQSGTFSATNVSTGVKLADLASQSGSYWEGLLATYPANPYTLTVLLTTPTGGQNYQSYGVCMAASTTGAMISLGNIWSSGNAYQYQADSWSSPTSHTAAIVSRSGSYTSGHMWFRVKDDGTNITMYNSSDGINWYALSGTPFTKSGSVLAGNFNFIGPCMEAGDTTSGFTPSTVIESYSITTP